MSKPIKVVIIVAIICVQKKLGPKIFGQKNQKTSESKNVDPKFFCPKHFWYKKCGQKKFM